DGSVTITPDTATTPDVKKVDVTYTPEGSDAPKTVVVEKDNDGKWTSTDPDVKVDQTTGKITIDADKVKDGTEVNVVATDDAGNNGADKDNIPVPANNPPTADNTTVTANEDTPIKAKLPTATDADSDPVTYAKGEDPKNGTVEIDQDGNYTYTPNKDFNGEDEFTYTVNDGKGGTNTYTVTVNVTPVNDPPVAKEDAITTEEDKEFKGSLPTATDADNDKVVYEVKTQPKNGTVTVNEDGTYTYTPNTDFNGEDSFEYTVKDNNGGENSYPVKITVTPVNDAPVAENTAITTNEGAKFDGKLPTATDKDNDTVTYTKGDTDPKNGTVAINPDGTYSYTPNENFSGTDSFTYTIDDGKGGKNTYTVNVTVTAAPVTPAKIGIEADTATATEGLDSKDTLTFKTVLDKATTEDSTALVKLDATSTATADDIESLTYTDKDGTEKTVTEKTDIETALRDGFTVLVPKGQQESAAIQVKTKNDNTTENDEKLIFTLSEAKNSELDAAKTSASGTITDPSIVHIESTTNEAIEGDNTNSDLVFALKTDKALAENGSSTVKLAADSQAKAADFDKLTYTDENGQTQTITDSQKIAELLTNGFKVQLPKDATNSNNITLHVKADSEAENEESVKLSIENPINAVLTTDTNKQSASAVIKDPAIELPKVNLIVDPTKAEAIEASLGAEDLGFNLTLDKTSETPITVSVKLDNSVATPANAEDIDSITYTDENGVQQTEKDTAKIKEMLENGFNVQIPAGGSSTSVVLHTKSDTEVEGKENLSLKIETPTGAELGENITASGTIEDPKAISAVIVDDRTAQGTAILTAQDNLINLADITSNTSNRVAGRLSASDYGKPVTVEITDSQGTTITADSQISSTRGQLVGVYMTAPLSKSDQLKSLSDGIITAKAYVKGTDGSVSASDISFLDLHAPDIKTQRFSFNIHESSKTKIEDITLATNESGAVTGSTVVKDTETFTPQLFINATDSKKQVGKVVEQSEQEKQNGDFAIKDNSYTFVNDDGTKSLTSQDGLYKIDPNTGELSLAKAAESYTKEEKSYKFYKVAASDMHENEAIQTVEIGIWNAPPLMPTYMSNGQFFYYENSAPDTYIGTLNETFTRTFNYTDANGKAQTIVAFSGSYLSEDGHLSKHDNWKLNHTPEGVIIDKTTGTVTFTKGTYQEGTVPTMTAFRPQGIPLHKEQGNQTGYAYQPEVKDDGTIVFRPPVAAFDDSDSYTGIAGSGVVAFEWTDGQDLDGDGIKETNADGIYRVDKQGNIFLTKAGSENPLTNDRESNNPLSETLMRKAGEIVAIDNEGMRTPEAKSYRVYFEFLDQIGVRLIQEDIYREWGVNEEGRRKDIDPITASEGRTYYIGWGENFANSFTGESTGSIINEAMLKLGNGDDIVFLSNSVGEYGAVWGHSGHIDLGNGNNYLRLNNDITGSAGTSWNIEKRSSVKAGSGDDIIIVGDGHISADADVISNAVVLTGSGDDNLLVRDGNIERTSVVDMGDGSDRVTILNINAAGNPENNIGHIKENSIVVLGNGNDELLMAGHLYESTIIGGKPDKALLKADTLGDSKVTDTVSTSTDFNLKRPDGFMQPTDDLKWDNIKDDGSDLGNDTVVIHDYVYNSYIYLGKGNDSLTVEKHIEGNKTTIDLGDGNDTFTFGGDFRSSPNVSGGNGTDTLKFTGSGSIAAKDIKSFEKVELGGGTFNLTAADLLADTSRTGEMYVSGNGTVNVNGMIKTGISDGYSGYGQTVGTTLVFIQDTLNIA
ncbi:cadherin-like domain-containing protein, partial [Chelonobacter oris]|uniref:cadherin-like domain-containing protein n=1 Tax=Chelonobacter oris TaxID=505317 RepID=UPI00244A1133